MGDQPGNVQSRWESVRGHTVVRAGVVYGSAVFFLLQVLDLLGVSASTIRVLAIVLVTAFVVGEGIYFWKSKRPASAMLAPERLRRWVLSRRRWVPAAVILLILGAGAWLLGKRLVSSPVRAGTDVIAVMPFVASGDDVEDLRIGMVSLLTTNLDQVGGIRTIDAGTVLHGWDRRAAGGSLDLQGALQVGRDVDAGAVLWGAVSAVREAVQVTAEIYTVDGERVAHGEERGDVDELHTLIDRLSIHLLREIWRGDTPVPDLRIAAITTESPQALRAFLRGERYFRAARYDSAITVLEDAVRSDTSFALAFFRLSEAYGWRLHFGAEPALRAAEAAVRFASRLPERERTLATAQLLHEHGDFAALDSMRAMTSRYPDDALAWYLLGDILTHSRPMLATTTDELVAPYRRAIELDPTPAGGMIHVIEEALYQGDRALFDEFLAPYRAATGPGPGRWEQYARVRWAPVDSLTPRVSEVASLFTQQRAPAISFGRLQIIVSTRFATEPALDPADLIKLQETVDPTSDMGATVLSRAFALADLGRIREASALLDTAAATPAARMGLPPPLLIRLIWGAIGLYPADSVASQLSLLAGDTALASFSGAITRLVHLGRGDLRAADAVALPPLPHDTIARRIGEPGMRMALDAWALLHRGDTTGSIRLMKDAIRLAGYSLPASQRFNSGPLFIHAATLSKRAETRAEGIRRLRNYLQIGSLYTVQAYLALAEALEAEGNLAEAAEAYAHVLRLWRNADPHLQPQVLTAREALDRLTGEARERTDTAR